VRFEKGKVIGGVTQVIEHLPSKYGDLSSNPSTTIAKKGRMKENRKLEGTITISGVIQV
jgi:hypothetical protein